MKHFNAVITVISVIVTVIGIYVALFYEAEHNNDEYKKPVARKVEPTTRIKSVENVKKDKFSSPINLDLKPKNYQLSSCFCGKYVPNSSEINVLRSTIDQTECRSQKAMIIECERTDDDARQCQDDDYNDDGYYAHKLICT